MHYWDDFLISQLKSIYKIILLVLSLAFSSYLIAEAHNLNLLVIYSPNAEQEYIGIGEDITSKIDKYIEFTNHALKNSKKKIEINLSHSQVVPSNLLNISSLDITQALVKAQKNQYIHKLREQYRADLVLILHKNGTNSRRCGLAAPVPYLHNEENRIIGTKDITYAIINVNEYCREAEDYIG